MKKLQTDNYILQEYFFKNFKYVQSLESVNTDKVLKDLQVYPEFRLEEVKLNESNGRKTMILSGDGFILIDIEDIKSIIAVYEKSYELITKYNLPTKSNTYEGKVLKKLIQYDRGYFSKEVTLLVFDDNTFYFIGEVCADKDYDHEPRLSTGFFCYGYSFFKHIGNEEIAKEWESYRNEIKYRNKY